MESIHLVIARIDDFSRREITVRGEEYPTMSVANLTNRISFEEYERMVESGVLDHARVELIYGEIVQMSPMKAPHISCLNHVNVHTVQQVGNTHFVQIQSTIRIPGLRSAPEPDLAIVRKPYNYAKGPHVADILLIGEVSDSTLAYDRRVKLPLYAKAGIPEAWIFNIVDERIERYTDPVDGTYSVLAVAERGQRLASTVLSHLIFATDEMILPESLGGDG